jgi:hypothetical protein
LNAWEISGDKKITINGEEKDLKIEDHHIIPLADATNIDQSTKELRTKEKKKHILNSPLNRTYISSIANQRIRDRAPDRYLQYVSESSQWGHCIPRELLKSYGESGFPDKDTYYEDLLTKRFHELKKEIKRELEELENI